MTTRTPAERFDDLRAKFAEVVAFGGTGLSILAALAIVALQIIVWAKWDRWDHYPVSGLLTDLGANLRWPNHATDWVGLAKIARWLLDVHVSVYIGLVGPFLSFMLGGFIYEDALNGNRDRRLWVKKVSEGTKGE